MRRTLPAKAFLFALVGTAGFVVDAGVLALLVHGGRFEPALARVVSIWAAMLFTWLANRHLTFAETRSDRPVREYFAFVAVNLGGAAINYLCFTLLVRYLATPLTLAVAIGSLCGMGWNFLLSHRYVFAHRKAPDASQPNRTARP